MHAPRHTGHVRPRPVPGELGVEPQLAGGQFPRGRRNEGLNVVKLADDALEAARGWESRDHAPSRVVEAIERSVKLAKMAERLVADLIDYIKGFAKAASAITPAVVPIYERLIKHAASIRARVAASIGAAYVQLVIYRRNPDAIGVPGKEAVSVISAPLATARDSFLFYDAVVQAINDVASVFSGNMLALAQALAELVKWLKEAAQAAARTIASVLGSLKTVAIVGGIGLAGLLVLSWSRGRE